MLQKVKTFLSTVWAEIVDTYEKVKVPLLAVLGLVVFIKWEYIKSLLTVYFANKELTSGKKEDAVLSNTETTENNQANALVKAAEELPKTETTVTEDWYKK